MCSLRLKQHIQHIPQTGSRGHVGGYTVTRCHRSHDDQMWMSSRWQSSVVSLEDTLYMTNVIRGTWSWAVSVSRYVAFFVTLCISTCPLGEHYNHVMSPFEVPSSPPTATASVRLRSQNSRRNCLRTKSCLTWLISALIWPGGDHFDTNTSDHLILLAMLANLVINGSVQFTRHIFF